MKEKNRIIWVFEGSAAGKEQFIHYIVKEKPAALLKRLGWDDTSITICNESIAWIGMSKKDINIKKRVALPNIILSMITKKPSVILIKGQDVDFRYDSLLLTKKLLPFANHEIIFLHTPIKIAYERWSNKPWKKFWYTKITVKVWLKYQLSKIHDLQGEFPITSLNSNDTNYNAIAFPPKL